MMTTTATTLIITSQKTAEISFFPELHVKWTNMFSLEMKYSPLKTSTANNAISGSS